MEDIYIIHYAVVDSNEERHLEPRMTLVKAKSSILALRKFNTIDEIVKDRHYCKIRPRIEKARIY